MSENENFVAEQEAEVVAEEESTVEQEVAEQTENKKKFNVLSIVVLAALGLAFIMGIVGICIAWLSAKMPGTSAVTDTLKELLDTNKVVDAYKGLEAIEAFAILAIISSALTAVSFVISKFINIKPLKYVTAGLAALLTLSALLAIILTATCTNTTYFQKAKAANASFVPAAGAWLLSIFGIIGGVLGLIGSLDNEGAKSKEFLRKRVVTLKRKPQRIPFFCLVVSGLFYLLCLNEFSQSAATTLSPVKYLGLCILVNVLFSILVLVLFLNAFPKHAIVNKKTGKRHKINIVMLVLGFAFIAVMIFLDALYIYQLLHAIPSMEKFFFSSVSEAEKFSKYLSDNYVLDIGVYCPFLLKSYNFAIAHIVLLGVTIIMYALLPLFKILLMKINTRKVLEENNITEVIDTED